MRVLITGVAGFIGSHLADRCLEVGHEVWGIDNLNTGREQNVHPGVHFFYGDIVTNSSIFEECKPEVIVHCAASYKDPSNWHEDIHTNVHGTARVAQEAVRYDAKLIYLQTALTYGSNPHDPISYGAPVPVTHSIAPENSYAISKTAGEQYIKLSGANHIVFRLANIYGPRNLSGPIPTFYKNLAAGEECTVVDTRREFVYVKDLIHLLHSSLKSDHQGVYHVSAAEDNTIRDIYEEVRGAMGNGPGLVTFKRRGEDDAARIRLDGLKTQVHWSWNASTPLTEGIREAVKWYQQNGVTETFTHLKEESVG